MDIDTKSTLARMTLPAGFHDAQFVSEYGRIESLRASRYGTRFSVIVIDITGLCAGPDEIEAGEATEALRKIASAVLDSTRTCDVAGLMGFNRIAVLLPETDYFGSLVAIRKISKAVGGAIAGRKPALSVLITHAAFPKDGKGFGELLSTAARRSAQRRESLWEKNGFRDKLFWEIIAELSGRNYSGFESASFDAGSGLALTDTFIDRINELIISEASRNPHKRGVLIFAAKKISAGLPVINALSFAGAIATKIFLVGEGEDKLWDIRCATPISIDDPRLRETFFTFFFNEDTSYALICRENWGATYSCFHTSDAFLVEGLITKFQSEYSLQEQLG